MQAIFGTDGIRGEYDKEINYLMAWKIGYALGINVNSDEPFIIGRDTRISGEKLLKGLSEGISSANKEVIDIGICPTPAIPCLIKELKLSAGIMISASHNPPEYNGIKIFDMNGKKISKDNENSIEKNINAINQDLFLQKSSGKYVHKFELIEIYEKKLLESIGFDNLNGMKIVLDTCYGSATACAEKIFTKLGADTIVINGHPDGSKINVKCGSTFLDPIKKAISEHEADMGFSFDGDADRVIGVDSSGRVMDGDHILFLWGRELLRENNLSKNLLITTIMANLGFENAWHELGGSFFRTEVGDKFIYQEILRQNANLGGEQSGHILSSINNYSGDGILTAIQIAKYCKRRKLTLNEWLQSSFLPYPQTLINLSLPFKIHKLHLSLKHSIDQVTNKILSKTSDPCRIHIRPSGTEPLLRVLIEAQHENVVRESAKTIRKELEKIIQNEINY